MQAFYQHLVRVPAIFMILAACIQSLSAENESPDDEPSDPTVERTYDLYVSSRNTNAVVRFNGQTGANLGNFVAPGAGGLSATQEVAFGYDGHLYVSGRGNTAILKFHKDTGAFLGKFTSGYALDNPTKMTFGPDSMLYVSQWGQTKSKVARFDGRTGAFVGEATSIDIIQGMGHTWDADGNLYVASFGSRNVQKFAPAGNSMGDFTDPFVEVTGIVNVWFGDDGYLYAADWEFGGIRRFDGQTGAYKDNFITGMSRTEGFTFGPDSLLYLCDWKDNVIVQYNPETGARIKTFTSPQGVLQPNSLTFGPVPAGD